MVDSCLEEVGAHGPGAQVLSFVEPTEIPVHTLHDVLEVVRLVPSRLLLSTSIRMASSGVFVLRGMGDVSDMLGRAS